MNDDGTRAGDDTVAGDDEVDFLLRSLDDLDAEHDAGDLDDDDYQLLRDGYTARAAEVLRAREEHRPTEPVEDPGRSRRTTAVWIVGVLLVAGIAGSLLARSVGHRGDGTSLTGSGASIRERKADCLSTSFQKPAEGIECYAAILKSQPDDVDALTYQGWAMVRSGDVEGGSANFDRVLSLDPTYPDVRVFRASVLNNAGDHDGAQAELDALYALDPPAGILSTLESMGLDREIAYQRLDPLVQPCWDQVEQAAALGSAEDQRAKATELFTGGLTCVSDVAAAHPDLLDALEMQGYLLGSSGRPELMALAGSSLDRAVTLAPTDPTPLLLRAALRNISNDFTGAIADLDALDALAGTARPSALYVLASPAEIRADVEQSLRTTTTVPR